MFKVFQYLSSIFVWLFVPAFAFAADPFTVAGVPVDASGATAIEAQTTAISEGQLIAAEILMNRLTLSSERSSRNVPPLTAETVAPLIRALEISNEKRSARRYLGDVTIAFNPSQVQRFLADRNLTMVSTQARARLVLPIVEGSNVWSSNGWQQAWANPALGHSLTPVVAANAGQGGSGLISTAQVRAADMDALRSVGRLYGVDQVLVAIASPSASGVSVSLKDIALDTGRAQNLGRVTGYDYKDAVSKSITKLEGNWKSASVSFAQNAVSMPVSVLYGSHNDWLRIKEVINNSAQIQDARLDALAKDGALMTLTYGGDIDRLANEMAFKGVEVRRSAELGMVVLQLSRRR